MSGLESHERTPYMICLPLKTETGEELSPSPEFSTKLLLKRVVGDGRRCARCVVTDDAALIAEKAALTSLSDDRWNAHNRVGLEARATIQRRCCGSSHIGEEIAALGRRCRRCTSQQWVNQDCSTASRHAARCACHCRQRPWELYAPGRGVSHCRSVDGTNRTDR